MNEEADMRDTEKLKCDFVELWSSFLQNSYYILQIWIK